MNPEQWLSLKWNGGSTMSDRWLTQSKIIHINETIVKEGSIMKSKLKNFSLLTISTLIMAVGIYFFKFANNFTFGGITGIAVLVAKFLPISASDFSFVVNILLLIIGWIVLGKSFAEKTAYSTILLSVSLSLLERIYPMSHPLTNEPLLELIFAILLPALGSAILFNIGASSGGTDVIAMILKKYTSVDIGKGLMISDLIFTLAGFLVFNVKTGLYSLFGLIMRSALIDNFIESFNRSKYFHVVTSNATCICDFIQNDLQRGATIVNATGAFTGDDKYIILTVLSPSQAVKLRNFIKEHDPKAFLLVSNTSEIIGKGFHSV